MIKKTLNKILETGIILAVTGVGIAGIVQKNSAKDNYESYKNKEQNIYSIYKTKSDSLYSDYLNQKEFLDRDYSEESDINHVKNYSLLSFNVGK